MRKLIIKVTVEGGYFKTNNKPPVLHTAKKPGRAGLTLQIMPRPFAR